MSQEIKIHGLTKHQVEMLDIMWSKHSNITGYELWKSGLSESDMNLADTLETLLLMELQERQLPIFEKEAKTTIAKIMRKT